MIRAGVRRRESAGFVCQLAVGEIVHVPALGAVAAGHPFAGVAFLEALLGKLRRRRDCAGQLLQPALWVDVVKRGLDRVPAGFRQLPAHFLGEHCVEVLEIRCQFGMLAGKALDFKPDELRLAELFVCGRQGSSDARAALTSRLRRPSSRSLAPGPRDNFRPAAAGPDRGKGGSVHLHSLVQLREKLPAGFRRDVGAQILHLLDDLRGGRVAGPSLLEAVFRSGQQRSGNHLVDVAAQVVQGCGPVGGQLLDLADVVFQILVHAGQKGVEQSFLLRVQFASPGLRLEQQILLHEPQVGCQIADLLEQGLDAFLAAGVNARDLPVDQVEKLHAPTIASCCCCESAPALRAFSATTA